jgi:hypothetical protein
MLAIFVVAAWLHEGVEIESALVLFGICFACELVDSGLGMGYGTILTPALLLLGYDARDIVPTVLLSELLSGFSAAFFHNEIKNVDLSLRGRDFRPALLLVAGSIGGVTAGVSLALSLPKATLNFGVGCIILLSGVFVLLFSRRAIAYKTWKMVALSAVASFNKAVSGGGYGPLVTSGQILSGVQTKASVGITSFAEAFTCLMGVTLFIVKGGMINVVVLIPMCTGALLSVPFSVFAINRTREGHLKVIIGVLTMCMGALTILKIAKP